MDQEKPNRPEDTIKIVKWMDQHVVRHVSTIYYKHGVQYIKQYKNCRLGFPDRAYQPILDIHGEVIAEVPLIKISVIEPKQLGDEKNN